MAQPTTPSELIAQAAARHQAQRDAAAAVSAEIAAQRAKDAADRDAARATEATK